MGFLIRLVQKYVMNLKKNEENEFLLLKKLKNTESAQLCYIYYVHNVHAHRHMPMHMPPFARQKKWPLATQIEHR